MIRRVRKGVGDRSTGDVVGAQGRARDHVIRRDAVGRDVRWGGVVRAGVRCPTAAHHGVRDLVWKVTHGMSPMVSAMLRRGEWCERNGRWTSATQERTIARHSLSRRGWRRRSLVGAVDDV